MRQNVTHCSVMRIGHFLPSFTREQYKLEDPPEKEGNEIDLLMLLAKVLEQFKANRYKEIICSLAKFSNCELRLSKS